MYGMGNSLDPSVVPFFVPFLLLPLLFPSFTSCYTFNEFAYSWKVPVFILNMEVKRFPQRVYLITSLSFNGQNI